jgi:TolB-like protein/DNA-binding winged helix-turn-helix (wHTH) protein/Flp pilus assembly protein TadD
VTGVLQAGFRLGGLWEVRPLLGTLEGEPGAVHLEPKVMSVLVFLAERSGEVISREELIERLWDGRIVSDEVLSRCISQLRTRLQDDPHEPRFIQTVPKIGYRLVATVEPHSPPSQHVNAETEAAAGAGASRGRGRALASAAIGVLVVVFGLFLGQAPPPDGDDPAVELPSIVVLPFVNRSDDPENEYFSDGLTEELIDRLASVAGLQVISSTTAFALNRHSEDVRSIAEQLGVTHVLEGHVRKDEERVRITVQLVDAKRGFQIWSQRFDSRLQDVFAVQDEIANSIVDELGPRLASGARHEISTLAPTEVMRAYELLLQARYHLRRREEAPIRRSIELFQEALELDPRLSAATVGLATAYALLPFYSSENAERMAELALAALQSGSQEDPALQSRAWEVLAFLHLSRWEWIEAEQHFRRALTAAPNDADIHQWYSQQLARTGDAAGSLYHAQRAKRLDLLSPVVNYRLAVAYLWVDDDARARQQFMLASELGMGATANPNAYLVLLLRAGEYDEAARVLAHVSGQRGSPMDWVDPLLAALRDPAVEPAAREALGRAARDGSMSPQLLYAAWLYLGDIETALDIVLEQLLAKPAQFDVEFLFARETAALRRHPRFGEVLVALGLDLYWDTYGWPAFCARRDATIVCDGPEA